MENSALLIIDVQNDIFEKTNSNKDIIPVINSLIPKFPLVIFVNEWNKKGNICLEHEPGSDIHKDIDFSKLKDFFIFKKTSHLSNSAFYYWDKDILGDNTTGLEKFLKKRKITHLYICGLNYLNCMKNTIIDCNSNLNMDLNISYYG